MFLVTIFEPHPAMSSTKTIEILFIFFSAKEKGRSRHIANAVATETASSLALPPR